MKKTNLLFVALNYQRVPDQLYLANEIIKIRSDFQIYFYVSQDIFLKYKDLVSTFPFPIINKKECNKISEKIEKPSKFKRMLNLFVEFIKTTPLYTQKLIIEESKYFDYLNNCFNKINSEINEYRFDLFFINGDRHLREEPVFLKISKVKGIKTVIPYLVDYSDKERILQTSPNITKRVRRKVFVSSYIWSSQTKKDEDYYYTHPISNALKKFGVLSENPFAMGAGQSDFLCLNNNHAKDKYITRGVFENKIKVVGDVSYDDIYFQYNKRSEVKKLILKKYKLDINKKIVIVSLPQLAEHGILDWESHWEEIDFLLSNICKLDQNVLVSLHPKMDKNAYEFIENKYGCKIFNERLRENIAIADLFVATFSSTIIWSVLCEVNSVVVDFYGLNYKMYDFLKSVKVVFQKKELLNALKFTLEQKIDFTEDWTKLSRKEVFDGQTIQRYIDLIDEVVKS